MLVLKYSVFVLVVFIVLGLIIVGLGLIRSPFVPPKASNSSECYSVDERLPGDEHSVSKVIDEPIENIEDAKS